jgi:hypothetical membrane protein
MSRSISPPHRRTPSFDRIAVWCGILAPVVALGCVWLATLVAAPTEFTWAEYALSDLGRREASTFWLFNGGLVAGGLAGIAFAWPLWRRARNRLERLGTGTFLVSVVGLGLVGVFYLPRDPHGPVAMLFFVGAPVTHWLYGAGRIRAGDAHLGRRSIALGFVHVLAWGGWILFAQTTGSSEWFAVPEMVASLTFGVWSVIVARRLLDEMAS